MSDFPQTSQVLDIFVPTFTELYDILSLYRKKAILSTGKRPVQTGLQSFLVSVTYAVFAPR